MTEYKVGDWVVDKISGQFFKIIQVDGEYLAVHHRFWIKSNWVRCVTPEEIKASKRSCTHSMTEITVFGDLKRIYECEKCGHKEYEEWVSHD